MNIAGVINVENIHTSAHIGGSAKVNCGLDCTSNVLNANVGQSVRVAAASIFVDRSVVDGASTGGNIAGAGSWTSLNVFGADVIEYLICSPATVPATANVYLPGWVGMNEAM